VPRQLVAYIATFGTQFFSLKCYHCHLFMTFVMLKTNKWNAMKKYVLLNSIVNSKICKKTEHIGHAKFKIVFILCVHKSRNLTAKHSGITQSLFVDLTSTIIMAVFAVLPCDVAARNFASRVWTIMSTTLHSLPAMNCELRSKRLCSRHHSSANNDVTYDLKQRKSNDIA